MSRYVRHASVAGVALALSALAACSGGGGTAGGAHSSGPFTFGVNTDPGNLDPQSSANQSNIEVASLAYDPLAILGLDGKLTPAIASSWNAVDPTTWQLTIRSGITCSDGTTLDGKAVADNINYLGNPKGGSGFTGFTVPSGATATASGDQVTVKLASPQPFLMQNMALVPMVCESGLKNRASLATASNGTGPYKISAVSPGASITYSLRSDYTPGLGGGNGTKATLPSTVVVKIVSNATTTANLLLGGQLNGAIVTGTDTARLKAAGLFSTGYNNLTDQLYFDHSTSALTSNVAVRRAIVQALNMQQIIAADTANAGTPATGMLAEPKICPGDNITGNLPAMDASAAKAAFTAAGWSLDSSGKWTANGKPVNLVLAFSSDVSTATNAAQTIASELEQMGIGVTLTGKPSNQLGSDVFGAKFHWDLMLFDLGFATPSQTLAFLSGDAPPAGTDIGGINNATFNALTTKALSEAGTTGCADWNSAEVALFKDADVAPTGQAPFTYFGKNATFQISRSGQLLPETLAVQ